VALLQNKVAIVTGAASGFGAEIARLYVKEGAKVAVADLNEAGAKAVAGELGGNAIAVKCDVAQRTDIDNLVAATLKQFGTIDIVVNNAGYTHKNQPMLDTDEAAFDRCFDVNVKSIYLMAQAVVPVLRKKKSGCIINVGSVSGMRPRPGLVWYSASKAAANLVSKAMAAELGPDNIRVNAISGGPVSTASSRAIKGYLDMAHRVKEAAPLRRGTTIDEVGDTAVYLCSDLARGVTGEVVHVDSGYHAMGVV
jgi:3-oxoacyl-[acyl-carrier protein] reductase